MGEVAVGGATGAIRVTGASDTIEVGAAVGPIRVVVASDVPVVIRLDAIPGPRGLPGLAGDPGPRGDPGPPGTLDAGVVVDGGNF